MSATRTAEGLAAGLQPPPRTGSFLLGVGLGGFVDGIVMHRSSASTTCATTSARR